MTSSQPYWGPILFVSSLNLHYDESVSFFGQGLSTGFLFSNLTQLQPPIIRVQKIIATKTTTFSESPGRQLSDGIPRIPQKNSPI